MDDVQKLSSSLSGNYFRSIILYARLDRSSDFGRDFIIYGKVGGERMGPGRDLWGEQFDGNLKNSPLVAGLW